MPFNPLSISGCTLWLKGDAGVYHDSGVTLATNGQSVQQWNDQSGSGHHATNTGTPPTYATGLSPSLLPCLNFANSGAMTAGFTVAAPYTIFVVYRVVDVTGNHRAVQGSNNWLIGPRGGFHQHFAGGFVTGTGPAVSVGSFIRAYATNSGTASHIVFDGTDFTSSTAPVTAPGTLDLGATGAAPSEGLANGGSPGHIAEVLVYNSALGSTDAGNVDGYLVRWQSAPASLFRRTLYGRAGSRGVA
jgi:hypothetical protein